MNILIKVLALAICINCCDQLNAAWQFPNSPSSQDSEISEVTQVAAKHILVNDRETAEKLRSDILNKKISFENAAKKFSTCPSKDQGGDLGFFERGAMVKEFENAAFSLSVGEISQPIQTEYGWHLIKVYDKK